MGVSNQKCHHCGLRAIVAVGAGNGTPLCLDCWAKFTTIHVLQTEEIERAANHAAAEFDSLAGTPGASRMYPPRQRLVVMTGGTILTNIHVSNSQISVLNTGTIGAIDGAITLVRESGQVEVASAIQALAQLLANDVSLHQQRRDAALEVLSAIAAEAALPKERRRSAVARALIVDFAQVICGIGDAAQLWAGYAPAIKAFFGVVGT